MPIVETLTTWVGQEDSLLGWLALAGSAVIEYVFPPFPGDIVTVLAASLVIAASWSWYGVLSALMIGSVIGAALTFELGVRWARRREARGKTSAGLDRLVAGFRKHGAVYLVLNRFVPGVRSAFFVAAGLAGMSRRAVYIYGALSSLLWNLLLFGAGAALGANYERLERLVTTYTTIAIVVVLGGVAAWFLLGWLRKRHRAD